MGLKAEKESIETVIRELRAECDQKLSAIRAECDQKVKDLLVKMKALSIEDAFQVGEKSYKFIQRPGGGELYNAQGVLIAGFNTNGAGDLTASLHVTSITLDSVDALGICKSLLAKQ